MPETLIQEHIKDGNDQGTDINTTELLEGLSKLEPKDIVESLNTIEAETAIKSLIESPVQEAIKDLENKKFEYLTLDQKDLVFLSAWLSGEYSVSISSLVIGSDTFDNLYNSISQQRFQKLYPAQQEETPESGEGDIDKIELDNISNLHLYGARTKYVTLPSKGDIVSAVNAIPEDKKDIRTTIATALKNSSKFEEDGDIDSSKEEIKKIQTELAKDTKLFGGVDGMFGLGTYRGILNLSKEENKKEDANLADIEDISITEKLNDNNDDYKIDRLETLGDGSLRIRDKKKSILLTPDGYFYKRDGYLGKYELKGDKLYYLGKDFALQSFDGKSWKYQRKDISDVSETFIKDMKYIIENQEKDKNLISVIENRDLDYNGFNSSDDAGEKYLIENIFKKAREKNAILTPHLLNGLKNHLVEKSIIDSNNNINYGNPSHTNRTKNNDKVEAEISNYMKTIAINT